MARKKAHEPHQNHERWLVSYADFITLLFAFFVVMYSISQVDAKKLGRLVHSMVSAFSSGVFDAGNPVATISPGSAAGIDHKVPLESIRPVLTPEVTEFAKIEESLSEGLGGEQALDRVSFYQDRRGLVISLAETGFFDSGSAEIREDSLKVLDIIVEALKTTSGHIRVEGHTDNIPIRNARFFSNWELSTARATSVIYYLIGKHTFPPQKLSASGYSEYHPVASNDSAQGRARNRRVDIVVLNEATRIGEEPH
jgi:chemotaxis protein MotB